MNEICCVRWLWLLMWNENWQVFSFECDFVICDLWFVICCDVNVIVIYICDCDSLWWVRRWKWWCFEGEACSEVETMRRESREMWFWIACEIARCDFACEVAWRVTKMWLEVACEIAFVKEESRRCDVLLHVKLQEKSRKCDIKLHVKLHEESRRCDLKCACDIA